MAFARFAARFYALAPVRGRVFVGACFFGAIIALTVVGSIAARGLEHTASRTALSADSYRTAVLADGPVAFWELDETAGTTAADASGNGRTGTYGAGTHSTTVAPIGADDLRSFGSTSTSGGVTAAPPASSLNVGTSGTYDTVELWMKWDGGGSGEGIFDFNSTSFVYALWILPTKIGFISGNGEIYGGPTTGLANSWHLIDAEFENGSENLSKLYIDGVAQTLSLDRANVLLSISGGTTVPVKIGGWRFSSSNTFTGQIDEVSLFKGALTPAQIAAHWAAVDAGSASTAAPVNSALPTLSGTFKTSSSVTTSNGTWQNGVSSFAYQWRRCDSSGANCSDISGATSQTYTVQGADFGSTLRAVVTATNSSGSTSATSAASVVSSAAPPAVKSVPAVGGIVDVGQTLTTNEGRWTSDITYANAVQWQRCDADGTNCADISGATGDGYAVSAADLGKGIRAKVTSTNAVGSATTYSALASNGDYWSSVKASAPVAWYHLNETSGGTAADSAGSAHIHNGGYPSLFNGYAKDGAPDGHVDTGVTSDPGHGAITVPYSADLNSDQFSVEAWVRPTGRGDGEPTAEGPIVTAFQCKGYHLSLTTGGDGTSHWFLGVPGGGSAVDPHVIELGQWYLVTGTFDGATTRLYVNGTLAASAPGTGYTPNTTGNLLIGRCDDLNSVMRPFDGNIDEVSIYDHAMTAAEVVDHATYVGMNLGQTYGDGKLAEDASDRWPGSVNAASGNFFTSVTDASMPGIGIPFAFSRNYNAADTASGPFGTGWTFSYGARLQIAANGDVTAIGGDGQQLFFTKEPDRSFLAANGGRSTLTALSGGGYEMVTTDQTHYGFSSAGRLTSLTERNGQGLAFTYDSFSNLSNIHQSAGRDIPVVTDASGHITQITLPDNRTVSYGYTNGLLTTVTDLRGGTITYSYDSSNRLQTIVDQNGHTAVTNTYGTDGRVTGQTDALGHTRGYGWDAVSQTSTFTDERGHVSTDVFTNNALLSTTDQAGNVTKYTYGQGLTGRSTTDPRGNVTLTNYDANGNLLTRTMPDGTHESFTYDSSNDVLSHTDARGQVTSYTYDAKGNRTTEVDPGNAETDYAYDPTGTGLLISTTDARDKVTSYAYDAAGNMLSTTSPLGEHTTMSYDSSGRLFSRVEPRGNVTGADPNAYRTTFTYDDADNMLSTRDPLGNVTSSTYDPVGNKLSTTDALNKTTTWAYDDNNELTTVTAPDDSQTTYTYDPAGNRLTKTDANTHTTSYGYDEANRPSSVTTPLGEAWTYAYDAAGNRASVAAPGGGTTSYTYDSQNRLTAIGYSDNTPDLSFTYDADGNRSTMQDGRGSTSYVYDNRDRVTSIIHGSGTFGYSYDSVGGITERQYPDGTTVDYSYDGDGRLSSVTSGSATSTYGYDAAGNQISLTLPSANGYVETRGYDNAGRVTEVKNANATSTLSQFDYAYDAVGDATQISTVSGVENYTYDDEGRITAVCYQTTACGASDPHIAYSYDHVGNRLTDADTSKTDTYSYNADDELASVSDGTTTTNYSYDARGNQTAAGTASYGFNLAEQLTSATIGGATTAYSYDGDGNRVQAAGASTTNYAWDTNNAMAQLATESDGSGATVRSYVYGVETLAMNAGGSSYYFAHDRLGSVVDVTSATGASEWAYGYDPFGNPRTRTKIDPSAPTNPLGFVGQLADPATGLYDMRARVYDPATGRFLSTDPLAADPTDPAIELYDYAGQDPVDNYDPAGTNFDPPGEPVWVGEGPGGEPRGGAWSPNDEPVATRPYKRPPNMTTRAQRASVQGKTCPDCGSGGKMYADHEDPLVVQHYRDGRIDVKANRRVTAVRPQCPSCSARQGGRLSAYSKAMRLKQLER
jgi:RHS repeat-associated protein